MILIMTNYVLSFQILSPCFLLCHSVTLHDVFGNIFVYILIFVSTTLVLYLKGLRESLSVDLQMEILVLGLDVKG